MSFLDILIGALLVYGLVRGVWKGLFVELASLLSLVIGIFIAIKFSGFTADFIREKFMPDSEYIEIIAFAVTFLLVVVTIILAAKVFTKIANFSSLGWINRLLGGVFGLLKMMLILSVFLHFFQNINQNEAFVSEAKLDQSVLYHPVKQTSELIFPVLTDWFDKAKEKVNLPETI